MSGALKSVFGGSGGILGAVLGVASMFFPPLAIAGSLSNLLTTAVGEAVKMAASALVKEFAMPKFLEAIVGQVVDKVLPGLLKETDPAVDAHVSADAGVQEGIATFKDDLASKIIDNTQKFVAEAAEKKKAAGGKGGVSAGSWLEAIALAMGEAMGQKAAQMVDLSHQMAKLSAKQDDQVGAWGGLNAKSSDKQFSKDSKTIEARDKANAMEFSKVQAQFQATSQEFSILSNSFTNAIKSIGEGLSTMARKG
ncbi:hypothetical protein BURC_00950 [Burkholderiaceae bacterium]|nr:hypothetical protein BURC_00950 [Burkholderiaceae bacterium]